ncbi:MAG: P-loop NTPase [Longimicrobiales bacterium]|nr:P-loop NTPase [Longimicrobiales bacterium]
MKKIRTYHEVESEGRGQVPEQVGKQMERLARRLADVRAVWIVASGKGGVGKSAVTANLAAALAGRGLRVGALDADLNGPSLARMLGAGRDGLRVDDDGVHPAPGAAGARVVSMDLLLATDDAPLKWKGPAAFDFVWQSALETGALREFLADVAWGDLDVLLLDLPPGTDKLQRAYKLIPDVTGVVLVTTPSEAARSVVARSLKLAHDLGAEPIGLVANMTARACPECGHVEALYEADGARQLAAESGAELWAEIPFDPAFALETDRGRPAADRRTDAVGAAFGDLATRVVAESGLGPLEETEAS